MATDFVNLFEYVPKPGKTCIKYSCLCHFVWIELYLGTHPCSIPSGPKSKVRALVNQDLNLKETDHKGNK